MSTSVVLRLAFAILSAATGLSIARAAPPALSAARGLVCDFNVVQIGQFKDLNYTGGQSESAISLTLVASAADASAGRAVMIEGDRAAVVDLIVQPRQTLFVDSGTRDDSSIISVFTASTKDAATPAAYSRQRMVGTIPVIAQYTGVCRVQEPGR